MHSGISQPRTVPLIAIDLGDPITQASLATGASQLKNIPWTGAIKCMQKIPSSRYQHSGEYKDSARPLRSLERIIQSALKCVFN